ncbi:unnamed protein product [Bursaphelenchus okinawaensis]|uniref:Uncharacterized protein n=1 Tax=Bursaphelenchus okinawaensis TaxID=465554 RepID=A0A811JPU5_9BILA|nr:unnamed protein product [Bursaphelenchus okinawaensis]CAG9077093.1 unnamed protein product [Bursaphelenchus okinawaensis]
MSLRLESVHKHELEPDPSPGPGPGPGPGPDPDLDPDFDPDFEPDPDPESKPEPEPEPDDIKEYKFQSKSIRSGGVSASMSRFLQIRDQYSRIFGRRFLNSQLSLYLGLLQLLVCIWALFQHVYSIVNFDQILFCDFTPNSTLPMIYTGVDAIIFDIGLFHSLWGIDGCVAQHLDGGYGRFGWCVTHIAVFLLCLPFAFVNRPRPCFLWPLLIQQSIYGIGLLILSLAALPRILPTFMGDLNNAPMTAIFTYVMGTCMNFFLLYVYWHWYWHVEEEWDSARKLRNGEVIPNSTKRTSPSKRKHPIVNQPSRTVGNGYTTDRLILVDDDSQAPELETKLRNGYGVNGTNGAKFGQNDTNGANFGQIGTNGAKLGIVTDGGTFGEHGTNGTKMGLDNTNLRENGTVSVLSSTNGTKLGNGFKNGNGHVGNGKISDNMMNRRVSLMKNDDKSATVIWDDRNTKDFAKHYSRPPYDQTIVDEEGVDQLNEHNVYQHNHRSHQLGIDGDSGYRGTVEGYHGAVDVYGGTVDPYHSKVQNDTAYHHSTVDPYHSTINTQEKDHPRNPSFLTDKRLPYYLKSESPGSTASSCSSIMARRKLPQHGNSRLVQNTYHRQQTLPVGSSPSQDSSISVTILNTPLNNESVASYGTEGTLLTGYGTDGTLLSATGHGRLHGEGKGYVNLHGDNQGYSNQHSSDKDYSTHYSKEKPIVPNTTPVLRPAHSHTPISLSARKLYYTEKGPASEYDTRYSRLNSTGKQHTILYNPKYSSTVSNEILKQHEAMKNAQGSSTNFSSTVLSSTKDPQGGTALSTGQNNTKNVQNCTKTDVLPRTLAQSRMRLLRKYQSTEQYMSPVPQVQRPYSHSLHSSFAEENEYDTVHTPDIDIHNRLFDTQQQSTSAIETALNEIPYFGHTVRKPSAQSSVYSYTKTSSPNFSPAMSLYSSVKYPSPEEGNEYTTTYEAYGTDRVKYGSDREHNKYDTNQQYNKYGTDKQYDTIQEYPLNINYNTYNDMQGTVPLPTYESYKTAPGPIPEPAPTPSQKPTLTPTDSPTFLERFNYQTGL